MGISLVTWPIPHDQGAEIGGEHRLPATEAHAHGAAGDVSHHETRVDDGHLRMLWQGGMVILGLKMVCKAL